MTPSRGKNVLTTGFPISSSSDRSPARAEPTAGQDCRTERNSSRRVRRSSLSNSVSRPTVEEALRWAQSAREPTPTVRSQAGTGRRLACCGSTR
jgi:hypothetical protein